MTEYYRKPSEHDWVLKVRATDFSNIVLADTSMLDNVRHNVWLLLLTADENECRACHQIGEIWKGRGGKNDAGDGVNVVTKLRNVVSLGTIHTDYEGQVIRNIAEVGRLIIRHVPSVVALVITPHGTIAKVLSTLNLDPRYHGNSGSGSFLFAERRHLVPSLSSDTTTLSTFTTLASLAIEHATLLDGMGQVKSILSPVDAGLLGKLSSGSNSGGSDDHSHPSTHPSNLFLVHTSVSESISPLFYTSTPPSNHLEDRLPLLRDPSTYINMLLTTDPVTRSLFKTFPPFFERATAALATQSILALRRQLTSSVDDNYINNNNNEYDNSANGKKSGNNKMKKSGKEMAALRLARECGMTGCKRKNVRGLLSIDNGEFGWVTSTKGMNSNTLFNSNNIYGSDTSGKKSDKGFRMNKGTLLFDKVTGAQLKQVNQGTNGWSAADIADSYALSNGQGKSMGVVKVTYA